MNLIDDLPRSISDLIKDHVDTAIKHRQAIRTKQLAVTKLEKHVADGTFPRSIQLKTSLNVPTTMTSPECIAAATAQKDTFNNALRTFQRDATASILELAKITLKEAEYRAMTHLASVDREIIEFHKTLHTALGHPHVALFTATLANFSYATLASIPRTDSTITSCLNHIMGWRLRISQKWDEVLAAEALAHVKKARVKHATIEAQAMVVDDPTNETVLQLIRRELKPIRDQLGKINPHKAERAPSAGKQKTSAPSSTRSKSRSPARPKSPKRPSKGKAAAKDAQRGRNGSRNSDGDARRGRSTSTKSTRKQHGKATKTRTPSTSRSRSHSRSRARSHRG